MVLASRIARSSPLLEHSDSFGQSLQGMMIWAPGEGTKPPPARFVAFRKRVTLRKAPANATLRLFADVRYLCWINGGYVARGPARFHPLGPEYDVIDVRPFLKDGDNIIAVVVMAGASNGKMMMHAPALTALLEIGQISGDSPKIQTDNTWKCSDQTRYRPASVNWGNVADNIDATVEDGDWTQPEYDDTKWKSAIHVDGNGWGPLTARRIPLLRETPLEAKPQGGKTLPATLAAGDRITFDVGRMSQAYTTLDLEAEAGSTIDMKFESVGYHYIARAGRQTYISSDTCGMKAAALTVKSGKVTLHSFKPVEALYPFECAGSFHSSDPLLDRIWSMCARSLQLLSEDAYVDCADRERTEWMDCDPPVFDVTRSAMAGPELGADPSLGAVGKLYADPRLLEEMLRRTALTVQPDGWVKAHTCSDRFDIHALMEDRGCDWVQGVRRYYESTGNAGPVREVWPVIVRQVQWLLDRRTSRGLVKAREWVVWGNPIGYVTCEGASLNAFVYRALADAAYLGGVIGERQQAEEFDHAAKALAESFNKVLWDEKNRTYFSAFYDAPPDAKPIAGSHQLTLKVHDGLVEPTMFPALFALDQGIVPDDRRAAVTAYLFAHRNEAKRIMTFYYLFNQLYGANEASLDQEVLDMIRAKWKPMADWGTSWEEFNGASKAHCYGLFPGYFLSAYVLGVRISGPVWNKQILIEPRLGDLKQAEGIVVTEFGVVPVSWKKNDANLNFELAIPRDTLATVRLAEADSGTLILDDKPLPCAVQGRHLTFGVKAGSHKGSVKIHPQK